MLRTHTGNRTLAFRDVYYKFCENYHLVKHI